MTRRNALDEGTVEFIRVLIVGSSLSYAAIARWAGCRPGTVMAWASRLGIRR